MGRLGRRQRDELIALIVQQQAVIRLERRIALEDNAKPGGPSGMPGLSPGPARNRPQAVPEAMAPVGPPPTGCPVESCPDCGTPCPATHRTREVMICPGSPRKSLHRPGLSPLPAQLPPPGGAGRGSLEAAPGGQPGQPGHPACPGIQWYLRNQLPRGRHRRRHPSHGATGPACGVGHRGAHPRQRRRTAGGRTRQRLCVEAAHRPLLPAAKSVVDEVLGSRWSAISTPPTTITTAPNSGAGPTCCGTSTTCRASTPMTPAGPVGRSRPRALR